MTHELAFMNEEMPKHWRSAVNFVEQRHQAVLDAYDKHVLGKYSRDEEARLLDGANTGDIEQVVFDLIFEEAGDPEQAARIIVADNNPFFEASRNQYYAARRVVVNQHHQYRSLAATELEESMMRKSAEARIALYKFMVEMIHDIVKLRSV
jgi:hypothetical protein